MYIPMYILFMEALGMAGNDPVELSRVDDNTVLLDVSPQSGHEQAGRRPGVIVSNEQFFVRTRFAVVCPIPNTRNRFPLHIPLDDRTKTTGTISTERMKCLLQAVFAILH